MTRAEALRQAIQRQFEIAVAMERTDAGEVSLQMAEEILRRLDAAVGSRADYRAGLKAWLTGQDAWGRQWTDGPVEDVLRWIEEHGPPPAP